VFPPFDFIEPLRAWSQTKDYTSNSDLATMIGFYVETSEAESRDALDKLIGLVK
jgi:hypothetical protein